MRFKIKKEYRLLVAEKLLDLGNLITNKMNTLSWYLLTLLILVILGGILIRKYSK